MSYQGRAGGTHVPIVEPLPSLPILLAVAVTLLSSTPASLVSDLLIIGRVVESQKGQLIVRELLDKPLFEFFDFVSLFNYYSGNATHQGYPRTAIRSTEGTMAK